MKEIRVLIVGTGSMANSHAEAFAEMEGVRVVAGVDPSPDRLAAFCQRHGVQNWFETVEKALAWGEFDVASVVTPDAIHHCTTLPLIAAGIHVLCEKPLAANAYDAAEMAAAAEAAGIVNMVNLTYRNGSALMAAAGMVADGVIGEARHFEASYLQSWLTQSAWGDWRTEDQWLWRLSQAHGSLGVLGDVGVHILDYATFVAGSDVVSVSCRLTTFNKADGNRIGHYHLDANDSMNLHVKLVSGAVGVIHASRFASGHINDLSLRIFGTKGGLDVKFVENKSLLKACLGKNLRSGIWEPINIPAVKSNFVRFIEAVRSGERVQPDFARGALLQKVIDAAIRSDRERSLDQIV